MAEKTDKVPNNVYTVLLMAAGVALLGACIFVWMRSTELTGSGNPFAILGK